jgi:hypothetical protein
MLWALSKGLSNVEASLETKTQRSPPIHRQVLIPNFREPDAVGDIIGRYLDTPIYRKITVDGVDYQFDRIQPPEHITTTLHANEHCLGPGIVYLAGETRDAAVGTV